MACVDTQFVPGQSGNAGGRPRTSLVSEACRQVLAELVPNDSEGRTYAQVIAAVLATKVIRGDKGAAVELANRAEGKPRQAVEAHVDVVGTNALLQDAAELERKIIEGLQQTVLHPDVVEYTLQRFEEQLVA